MRQVIRSGIALAVLFVVGVQAVTAQATFESSLVFGNWSDAGSWVLTSGSDGDGVPDADDTAIISAGDIVTLDANAACEDLLVQAGGQLYANTSSARLLDVYGDVLTVNGTLGNGTTTDGIIVRLYHTAGPITVSGAGDFDALRMLFAGSASGSLNLNMDVSLRGTGPVFYNVATGGSDFDVTLAAGKTLNLTNGNWSLDGAAGNGNNNEGGTMTVNGTLNVGGVLYLESNNTAGTGNAVGLHITSTGTVSASRAITSASGTDRFTLTMDSGAALDFTFGSFGDLAGDTQFSFHAASTVSFSGSTLTVSYPDADEGDADLDIDNVIKLAGTGTKSFSGDLTINGTLSLCEDAALDVAGTLLYNSTLEYNGSNTQTVGNEWPAAGGPSTVIINNEHGVILSADRTVSGTVSMVKGTLETSAFTLDLGTTGVLSGETNARRIIGSVTASRSDFSGNQSFGDIGFTLASGGTDPDAAITVRRVSGPSGITNVGGSETIARRFEVTYAGSAFEKDLTLAWFQAEDNGKTLSVMEMHKFDDVEQKWILISPEPRDASATRTITETITGFSDYTASDAFNQLPVELTSFDAVADFKDVILRWETASETNNAGFEVQVAEGDTFRAIDFVDGYGTTEQAKSYTYRVDAMAVGRHVFRLKQIDYDGTFEYSPEVEIAIELPEVYALSAAYPNPFNPQTQFTLSVAREQQVQVTVYDVTGRQVAELFNGVMTAHQAHPFTFDASHLPSGVYFYRAVGEAFVTSRSMVLQK